MGIGSMRWTVIVVSDAIRTARFYEYVFGWQIWYDNQLLFDSRFHPVALPVHRTKTPARLIILGDGDSSLWEEDYDAPVLALMEYEEDIGDTRNHDRESVGRGDIVLMARSENPDEVYNRALANGARSSTAPCDWTIAHPSGIGDIGFRTASFFDPEGTYVEVSTKRFTP